MTGSELIQYQLNDSGKQVFACYEGLAEANWDSPVAEHGMTPRQITIHLAECCVAFLKSTKGEEHNWGSYSTEETSSEGLLKEFTELRAQAVSAAINGDDEAVKHASDYLVLHETYHVGQLSLYRLKVDPDWNYMSIYGM